MNHGFGLLEMGFGLIAKGFNLVCRIRPVINGYILNYGQLSLVRAAAGAGRAGSVFESPPPVFSLSHSVGRATEEPSATKAGRLLHIAARELLGSTLGKEAGSLSLCGFWLAPT